MMETAVDIEILGGFRGRSEGVGHSELLISVLGRKAKQGKAWQRVVNGKCKYLCRKEQD